MGQMRINTTTGGYHANYFSALWSDSVVLLIVNTSRYPEIIQFASQAASGFYRDPSSSAFTLTLEPVISGLPDLQPTLAFGVFCLNLFFAFCH